MAAKIATYLSASHYFDLSLNGNEKMCHKQDGGNTSLSKPNGPKLAFLLTPWPIDGKLSAPH